ncbi:acyltransferase family protein [Azotobacter armeniacus]
MKSRIKYLDGHRGIALLLVVLFHAYARWPELVPYGDSYGEIPFFKYGWLGVQLFFLISGFVILMTLERCKGISEFIYRRWLRLFPAMLVCSLLIFSSSSFFIERPAGTPELESLLPGLTFISPSWWERIIGHPINPLEGAFWSIYVEFKFYIFSAIAYYWRGQSFLMASLVFVFALSIFFAVANKYIGGTTLYTMNSLTKTAAFEHFGWFASGAAFYVYSQARSPKYLIFAIAVGFFSSIATSNLNWPSFMAAILVLLFFASSIVNPFIQNILSSRVLQFFGAISYPLYLFHENAMISMIIKLGDSFEFIPHAFLPALPIAMLVAVAYFISKHIEPYARKVIAYFLGILGEFFAYRWTRS